MQAATPDLSCNPLVLDKPTTGKTKLDPTVASRLLDLLSSDDKFRALFKSDPMGALIEAGHVFPANQKSGGLGEGNFSRVSFAIWLANSRAKRKSRQLAT